LSVIYVELYNILSGDAGNITSLLRPVFLNRWSAAQLMPIHNSTSRCDISYFIIAGGESTILQRAAILPFFFFFPSHCVCVTGLLLRYRMRNFGSGCYGPQKRRGRAVLQKKYVRHYFMYLHA